MFKSIKLIICLVLAGFLLSSCGVSRDDYNALSRERNRLSDEVDDLSDKVDSLQEELAATKSYEGKGFASPEDAARAYLEALSRADIDAMIAACAVESYVDHYDFEYAVRRIKMYSPSMISQGVIMPNTNEISNRLNIKQRAGGVTSSIYHCILTLAFTEVSYAGTNGQNIPMTSEAQYTEFFNAIHDTTDLEKLNSLEIQRFLTKDDMLAVNQNYGSEGNQRHIDQMAETFGCQLADVAAVLDIGGEPYLFGCSAAQYDEDGKWYLLPGQSNFLAIAGVSAYYMIGGICPIDMSDEVLGKLAR